MSHTAPLIIMTNSIPTHPTYAPILVQTVSNNWSAQSFLVLWVNKEVAVLDWS